MPNYNLNLKRVSSKIETPINLIIRWENNKLVYSTQEKIHPQYFETEKGKKGFQRARTSYAGAPELNERLEQVIGSARTAFRRFVNDNQRSPSPNELKEALDQTVRGVAPPKVLTFLEFVATFISEAERQKVNSDSGKLISPGTVRIYKNTLRRLKEFASTYQRRVDFEAIDLQFYDQWIEFLSIRLNLSNNTVGRYTKTLKVFLNEATERGFNSNLAFRSKRFKVIQEQAHSIYLNEQELTALFQLDLSGNKRLERVRDLFVVGCWTGLRFGDLTSISPESIKGDKLEVKTQKTGQRIMIPLHWMVSQIMTHYSDYPNSLPPSISNVKMNKYLKEVAAQVSGLHESIETTITRGGKVVSQIKRKFELVTVHSARRSFATNLAKSGLSSLTIMKLTGHRSERVFLGYLKTTAEENAELLREHWKKLQDKNSRKSESTIELEG